MQTCPLCKSGSTRFLFISHNRHGRHDIDRNDTFSVYNCNQCELVFLSNIRVDTKYLNKYYSKGYYDEVSASHHSLLSKVVSYLEKYSYQSKEKLILNNFSTIDKKIKILDVGCGSGKFLESLNNDIFEKYGVEINKEGIRQSKKKGLRVYEDDITNIDFGKKKFNVVTLWHVLEHLNNPIDVYKKIHSILADNGVLMFATPNTESLGFQYGYARWFHLDSPRHLMLFNMKNIELLCKKSGFNVISTKNEFYDYPLDLFWSVQNTAKKYLVYPVYPFVKFFNKEALTVICKKTK